MAGQKQLAIASPPKVTTPAPSLPSMGETRIGKMEGCDEADDELDDDAASEPSNIDDSISEWRSIKQDTSLVSPADIKLFLQDTFRKTNVVIQTFSPELPQFIQTVKMIIKHPDYSNFNPSQRHRLKKCKKLTVNCCQNDELDYIMIPHIHPPHELQNL